MKKLVCIGVVAFLATTSMMFAGGAKEAPVQTPKETTRTLVDDLKRTVVIPENPQRILGLTSNAMEGLYNIGSSPIGKVADYKIRSEGVALPPIGLSNALDMEAILSLKPDLIIAMTRIHARQLEVLETTGAAIYFINPDSLTDRPLTGMAERIGLLLDKKEEAATFTSSIEIRAAELAASVQALSPVKTAVILQDGEMVLAAQSASGFGSLLTYLKLSNIVPANLPGSGKASFVNFDAESIVAADPDVIFMCAPTPNKETNKKALQKYLDDPKYKTLKATRNGTFIILPFEVNPNRSSAVDMIEITSATLLQALSSK